MNPFPDWIDEVKKDQITVAPFDIRTECQANLWCFSLSEEQRASLSIDDVEKFVHEVLCARSSQLLGQGHAPGSMVFYCWHDQQAGQLRFSIVSLAHGLLPFGCPIERVKNMGAIINDWLRSPNMDAIPWREFREVEVTDEVPKQVLEPAGKVLPVWGVQIPLAR